MLETWSYTLISVLFVSLISLIGIFTISINLKLLKKILIVVVAFAAGALLGDVFLHLLPHLVEENGFTKTISIGILVGMILFFILEKFIHWNHCHHPTTKEHPHHLGIMNIVGDVFHNFLDGMIIAASYLVSLPVGIATTIAVVLHEIPQEIGDFGILLHAGYSKSKAILLNFLTALSAFLGAIIILIWNSAFENIEIFLIPITAGGFIYIAAADIIPELHKSTKISQSILQLLFIILGIVLMFILV